MIDPSEAVTKAASFSAEILKIVSGIVCQCNSTIYSLVNNYPYKLFPGCIYVQETNKPEDIDLYYSYHLSFT